MYVDSKASGEESKVSLWGYECRSTSNAAAQAKEEGWQDGLKLPGLAVAEQHHSGKGSPFRLSLPHLYRLFPFRSIPSFEVLLFGVAIRR